MTARSSSPRVALITCSNGLGHARRSLATAARLTSQNICTHLFAPTAAYKRILDTNPIISRALQHNFQCTNFDTNTTASSFSKPLREILSWQDRLPPLDSFDLVISDNLPEILALYPKAWLSGNFFWHDAVPVCNPDYRNLVEDLITSIKPLILTYGDFAFFEKPTHLNIQNTTYPFFSDPPDPSCLHKDALLVSAGHGSGSVTTFGRLAESLRTRCSTPFSRILFDPSIFSPNEVRDAPIASYTPEMYLSLRCAIARPGMGTITDCIWSSTKIFPVFEQGNLEMERNARRLHELGLGEACTTAASAYDKCVRFQGDLLSQERFFQRVHSIQEIRRPTAEQVITTHLG